MVEHNVFNDLWGSGRGPHHLPFPEKTMEIILFSMISGLGRGPGTSHLPKNNRNHAVFNDFGDALGIPMTPHRAKKLLKSVCLLPMYGFPDLPVPSYSQELHSPPPFQKGAAKPQNGPAGSAGPTLALQTLCRTLCRPCAKPPTTRVFIGVGGAGYFPTARTIANVNFFTTFEAAG